MDPSTSLPVEIMHVIFNEVDSSNDQQTLKVCSLVCRLFLVLCRKHLFSRVTIFVTPDTGNAGDRDQKNQSAAQFLSFLAADNHTSSLIQSLNIRNDTGVPASSTWTTVARSLDELLPKLSLLTSLSIHGNLITDWTSSDIVLREVLMRLCRRPTLKTLNLNFMGISRQELLSLVVVQNLSLSSIHLIPDTPASGLQENSSSLINVSHLSTLSVVVGDLHISQAMWSLARASASTLKSLKWMSSPYHRNQEVFLHLIDLKMLPKLTSLAICLPLRTESPLKDLIILLRNNTERNDPLEILEILCDYYDHLPGSQVSSAWAWQELDDILASPALAALQTIRVSIKSVIRPKHIPSRDEKVHAKEAVELFQNSLPNACARGLIHGDEVHL